MTKRIIVSGDLITDCHVWTSGDLKSPTLAELDNERSEFPTKLTSAPGGVDALGRMIELLAATITPQPVVDRLKHSRVGRGGALTSHAIWRPYETGAKDSKEEKVWRCELELGRTPVKPSIIEKHLDGYPAAIEGELKPGDVVVLYDFNCGFGDCPAAWPKPIGREEKPLGDGVQVLLLTRSFTSGLYRWLTKWAPDRLILILSYATLRMSGMPDRAPLTIEARAEVVRTELRRLPAGTETRGTIVYSGMDGAIARWREGQSDQWVAYYNPKTMHATDSRYRQGRTFGYSVTFAAPLAIELAKAAPEFDQAAARALTAVRKLHEIGPFPIKNERLPTSGRFPAERIVREFICGPLDPVRIVDFTEEKHPRWSLLSSRGDALERAGSLRDSLDGIARVGVNNTEALIGVPSLAVGEGMTILDRFEIENYEGLRLRFREYLKATDHAKGELWRPISGAVFGPPGSGKSFGIGQLVTLDEFKGRFTWVAFNVSQCTTPRDLIGAFNRVRDQGVTGSVPLVIWDEFDSKLGEQNMGWLRWFLGPMQDGKYDDDRDTRVIGRAVFLFVGGTCSTFEEFKQRAESEEVPKGTDFVSRLTAHINVLGIDGPIDNCGRPQRPMPDVQIRRAVLLRSLLNRLAPALFRPGSGMKQATGIHTGVINAFCAIPRYEHGARSMEAIIRMSSLAGKTSFLPAYLPSTDQLGMHVDAERFLTLAKE